MKRLLGLTAALLLAAALPAQAQITCVGGGCGRPFSEAILLPDANATTPSLAGANDTNTGVFFDASNRDQFRISAGGVTRCAVVSGGMWCLEANGAFSMGVAQDLTLQRGGTNGALRVLGGTTPTGTNCGTGATYAGNNTQGQVTIGTTPGTCVITFNGTWSPNAPRCFCENNTTAQTCRATGETTTQFTINGTIAASDVIQWRCESS